METFDIILVGSLWNKRPINIAISAAFAVSVITSLVIVIRNLPRGNPLEGFDVDDPSDPPDPGREAGG